MPDVPPTFAIASSRHFEKVLPVEPRTGRLTASAFFELRMAAG
ncbi:MAG: hypothetical protein ACJ8HJ_27240 [Massilia sp.]